MNQLARVLGVNPSGSERLDEDRLVAAGATALGAWLLMAWNRFGVLAFTAPRSSTRFVLIGFYAWIGLAGAVWALARLVEREPSTPVRFVRTLQMIGLAHRPLLVVAIVVQITALIVPLAVFAPVFAIFGFGFWMPAMLVGATMRGRRITLAQAAGVVALPYLLWLATAGRFLFDRVGHLV